MRLLILLAIVGMVIGSCSSTRTGCPTTGRNVGAEKLVVGDPKAIKEAKKAPKFKLEKF